MNQKKKKIFEIVSKNPRTTVKELADMLDVSEVTVRKYLNYMEEEGLLKRIHGGAVQMSADSLEKRRLFRYEEKLRIAKEAAKLVADGEIVLVESGSTSSLLAQELALKKDIHIITNSLYIARAVKCKVTLLGGELQKEAEAMVGPLARLALSIIQVDKAFIGMDGFSEELGFTCGDFMRAEIGREMVSRAEKTIVLAESTKFDNIGMTPIVGLNSVNMVITDNEISEKYTETLKNHGIEVVKV